MYNKLFSAKAAKLAQKESEFTGIKECEPMDDLHKRMDHALG